MKLLLIIISLVCCISLAQAKVLQLIKNGMLTDPNYQIGRDWYSQAELFIGSGTGRTISLPNHIDPANFRIDAKLTLTKLNHSAAGIKIGKEFIGFDGAKDNRLFTEGGDFGKLEFHDNPIVANQPFDLEIVGKDKSIQVSINNKRVINKTYNPKAIAGISLRPHRGTLEISNFSVEAKITPLRKLNHLFASGKEGYKSYRIPALVTTKKGTLLAFCEGRKNHAGDHGDIDLVMKRSTDNGATWSPLEVVVDNGKNVAGNAAPIADLILGHIHLIYCTSSHSEGAIYDGKGRRGIFHKYSKDEGKTWSEPSDISANIYPKRWRWYATGPCSGIQIQSGKHVGRLVCPANHTVVEKGSKNNVFKSHSIYSDDNGETWHLGDSSAPGGNESQIAESAPDQLYQNMRMQSHRKGLRSIRRSSDGGESWTDLHHESQLPGPVCQGSVIRDYSTPSRLIFSNPGTQNGRNGMTIRISEDGGKTWPFAKLIHPASSAYSDLTITKNHQVAILYEAGNYNYSAEGIVFEKYSIESLKIKRNK